MASDAPPPPHPDSPTTDSLNQVVPNLWIGDLLSTSVPLLLSHNITHVVSVLRPALSSSSWPSGVSVHAIEADDTPEQDILQFFDAAVAYIASAIDGGGVVLVHCHAGMSRSAAFVAAYLLAASGGVLGKPSSNISSKSSSDPAVDAELTHRTNLFNSTTLTPTAAVDLIRLARPQVYPSRSFMNQLEVYHSAGCRVDMADRGVRQFYVKRRVREIAPFRPHHPRSQETPMSSPAVSSTPGRRKIRCKMCRQPLAVREHMMDHILKQAPASGSGVINAGVGADADAPSKVSDVVNPLTGERGALTARVTEPEAGVSGNGARPSGPSQDEMQPSIARTQPLLAGVPRPTAPSNAGAALPANHPLARLAAGPTRPPVARPVRGAASGVASEASTTPTTASIPAQAASAPFTPILTNPKCSGYFLEPLTWMEPVLEKGETSGKLVCPNARCGVKIGNYDWAGVQCGCREWVTPGFCVHRSKVDEVS